MLRDTLSSVAALTVVEKSSVMSGCHPAHCCFALFTKQQQENLDFVIIFRWSAWFKRAYVTQLRGIKGGNGKSIVCDLYVGKIRLSGSDVSVFGAPLGNKSDPGARMWMVLMSNFAPNKY